MKFGKRFSHGRVRLRVSLINKGLEMKAEDIKVGDELMSEGYMGGEYIAEKLIVTGLDSRGGFHYIGGIIHSEDDYDKRESWYSPIYISKLRVYDFKKLVKVGFHYEFADNKEEREEQSRVFKLRNSIKSKIDKMSKDELLALLSEDKR